MKIFQLLPISWNLCNWYNAIPNQKPLRDSLSDIYVIGNQLLKYFDGDICDAGNSTGHFPSLAKTFTSWRFCENPRPLLRPFKAFTSCIQKNEIFLFPPDLPLFYAFILSSARLCYVGLKLLGKSTFASLFSSFWSPEEVWNCSNSTHSVT
jgi:hypothetical protein